MVKFTIEVSEGYLEERANVDNNVMIAADSKDPKDAMMAVMNSFIFGMVNQYAKKGRKEWVINSLSLDSKARKLFNDAMVLICSLAPSTISEEERIQLSKEDKENED